MENLGIWSPKRTCRSTPDSDMDARRITPPLEPSLSMARERAADKKKSWGSELAAAITARNDENGTGLGMGVEAHRPRNPFSPFAVNCRHSSLVIPSR